MLFQEKGPEGLEAAAEKKGEDGSEGEPYPPELLESDEEEWTTLWDDMQASAPLELRGKNGNCALKGENESFSSEFNMVKPVYVSLPFLFQAWTRTRAVSWQD